MRKEKTITVEGSSYRITQCNAAVGLEIVERLQPTGLLAGSEGIAGLLTGSVKLPVGTLAGLANLIMRDVALAQTLTDSSGNQRTIYEELASTWPDHFAGRYQALLAVVKASLELSLSDFLSVSKPSGDHLP